MSSTRRPKQIPDRRVLWGAQLSSAVMVTALAWWLPELVAIQPIPAAALPVLGVGIGAVPLAIVLARVLDVRRRRSDIQVHEAVPSLTRSSQATQPDLGRYLVVVAIAELPAILGLVYVLIGGDRLHAVGLGAAAVILLLSLWPGAPGEARG
ncbi:hypothetical protein G3480_01495 [Thiorhodococcus mannitoliphagus]|uniref:Uncharacterized protein n=1 Tax=Thiorhodococcus mannitoliphagus TaxID=329406 RepID=A0A6P1DQ00_9GAMM|nr:hypothetical protein [Thiorhodococcus mannitoliphagus]NEX19001.1 hypothetical protein [Thiorhodococcus mannitoliphagus]